LQKLNEDCEAPQAQLKEHEEAVLPIARLLVPHSGGPKIAPLVDRLKEAPSRLATYVKHMTRSVPKQVLAFMKSYFPKAPVEVVAGGVAANCTNEQYAELLEQMAPIVEQVANERKVPSMSTRSRDLRVWSPIVELMRVVVLGGSPVEGSRQ
jgi:hypothetical protein